MSEFTWERPAATSAPPCPHESVVYVRAGETGGDPDALRGSLIVGDAAAIDACGGDTADDVAWCRACGALGVKRTGPA